jgi:hypothetical protein
MNASVTTQGEGFEKVEGLHQVILTRLYHEDNLLAQRTSNFLTGSGLLAAGLAVAVTGSGSPGKLAYAIAVLGLALSVLEIALGRISANAVSFWRGYLRRIEESTGVPVDTAVYDYYLEAEVASVVGHLKTQRTGRNDASRAVLRLIVRVVSSMNDVVALGLPLLVTAFWLILLAGFLWQKHIAFAIAFLLMVILSIALIFFLLPRNKFAVSGSSEGGSS